ncbi:P-loop NTPase fold protein [Paenibacillus algorifonticola]|nr:P-loop NTPase fold protein [Paenibacillus algorifonticola]
MSEGVSVVKRLKDYFGKGKTNLSKLGFFILFSTSISYAVLLCIRLAFKPILNTTPTNHVIQLVVIMYAAIWLAIVYFEFKQHVSLFLFKTIRRKLLPAVLISIILDYGFNDQNRLFSGGVWSDLYDVNVIAISLYAIILTIKKLLAKKGEPETDAADKARKYQFHSSPSLGIDGTDSLGREKFAKDLAAILIDRMAIPTDHALTIGLYGPWGSGKSSIFDLIEKQHISKEKIIRFHPWYMGKDQNNIIPEFLKLLISHLENHQSNSQQKLIYGLKKYSKFLTTISIRPPGFIVNFKDYMSNPEFSKDFEDAQGMREHIIDLLKTARIPMVVFIDDIDRLDNKEIQMIFKLVRLIADFPNITYVLAMDEKHVAKSLSQLYSKDYEEKVGLEYISKFIHVPLYLPRVDSYLMIKAFKTSMMKIINDFKIEVENDYIDYLDELANHFQFTPRNMERVANIAMVHMPMLKKETNPKDLLALLAIKIDNPELFAFIYKHSSLFLGGQRDEAVPKEQLEKLNVQFPTHISLLTKLFPVLGGSSVNKLLSNKNKLICSSVHFDTYFQYAVPSLKVSNEQLQKFYTAILDSDEEGGKVYGELVTDLNREEFYHQLWLDIAPEQVEKNMKVLKFVLDWHQDFTKFTKQMKIFIVEIFKVLIREDNDNDNDEVVSVLSAHNDDLLIASQLNNIGSKKGEWAENYISAHMDLSKLMAYPDDVAQITFNTWAFNKDKDDENIRKMVSDWTAKHGIWKIVRMKMTNPLEDYSLAFCNFANLLSILPIEEIEEAVKIVGEITSEHDFKSALKAGEFSKEQIELAYLQSTGYTDALRELYNNQNAIWSNTFITAVEQLCQYGSLEKISEIKEEWTKYKTRF